MTPKHQRSSVVLLSCAVLFLAAACEGPNISTGDDEGTGGAGGGQNPGGSGGSGGSGGVGGSGGSGGSGGAGGAAGAGGSGAGGTGGSAGAGGSGAAGSGGSGAFDPWNGEDGTGAGDSSKCGTLDEPCYFGNARELCGYVNESRMTSSGHERFRGFPWKGEYHNTRTWPITFTVDDALVKEAQAEADRLKAGGSFKGSAATDGSLRNAVYFDGVDTAKEIVATKDEPGKWTGSFAAKAALINSNGTMRQGLYYHDPGGMGPVLKRMGCGMQVDEEGYHWWVVVLAP